MKTDNFIKGLPLCRAFFFRVAKPILDECFPDLRYTAGLFGYGSDVLGYDDTVSTDHMWGPRFYLLLEESDFDRRDEIFDALAARLPYTFEGYSVNFSVPNMEDHGVRTAEYREAGPVHPLIFIDTVDRFTKSYLGKTEPESWDERDWLACSEHRLLGFTSGELYVDNLQFAAVRAAAARYPDVVRRYLIASQWFLLAEEQAFVRRCGDVSDDIGSRLCTARMMERLMRLCFLYCDCYAPYSKWFGTAFGKLPVDPEISIAIAEALRANHINSRERAQVRAQHLVAALHNKSGLTDPVDTTPRPYFSRKIQVIGADRIAAAVAQTLTGSPLEGLSLIGSVSQVSNLTVLYEDTEAAGRIRGLYE